MSVYVHDFSPRARLRRWLFRKAIGPEAFELLLDAEEMHAKIGFGGAVYMESFRSRVERRASLAMSRRWRELRYGCRDVPPERFPLIDD